MNYTGSGKLQGFSTIVTGGDSGIGRAVAVLFAREGADVAIVHPLMRGDCTKLITARLLTRKLPANSQLFRPTALRHFECVHHLATGQTAPT